MCASARRRAAKAVQEHANAQSSLNAAARSGSARMIVRNPSLPNELTRHNQENENSPLRSERRRHVALA
jgi:hypothetical protein